MNVQMTMQFADLLKQAALPIAKATGLPNHLYIAPEALDLERKSVFGKNWAAIGFAHDVPEPGDLKPVDFLGEPLLVSHGRDGIVRVFQNVCRHRGVKLIDEACKSTGLIRCPYHAWCYSTEGALKQTPHAGGPGIHHHPDIRKSELGLVEVRSHQFLGVVFVNLDGKAAPFETAFSTLMNGRWAEYATREVFFAGPESAFKLEVDTNWKLAVENYCESYHLPFIHPGLNEYSKLEDHENILGDGPWAGQLTRVYNPQLDENGRQFPVFEKLSDRWDTSAEYLTLYPNCLMGVHKDHTFAIILEPVTEGKTIEHVAIFYTSDEVSESDWETMRTSNAALWKGVFEEDIYVVESMQKGRRASGFDGGHFSPVMDESTHHFHAWIAGELLAE